MGIFDRFKKRQIQKEIDKIYNQELIDKRSDEDYIKSMKAMGMSRSSTEELIKYKNGIEDPGKIDEVWDESVNSLANIIKYLMGDVLTDVEQSLGSNFSLKEAIQNDMLHYISGISTMAEDFDAYAQIMLGLLNRWFGNERTVYTVNDIKRCLKEDNLENIIVNYNRMPGYADKLDHFTYNVQDGLSRIIRLCEANEDTNFEEVRALYGVYETVYMLIINTIDGYINHPFYVYEDFYILINNCNLTLLNFIPDNCLTDEFVSSTKVINLEMKKRSKKKHKR